MIGSAATSTIETVNNNIGPNQSTSESTMTTTTTTTLSSPSTNNISTTTLTNSDEDSGLEKLYQLGDNWLELESDPGLFTLLIRDFGCPGAEVEEIYDLQSSFNDMDQVYGFIFLFNVIEERRNRSQRFGGHSNTALGHGLNYNSPSSLLSGDFLHDETLLSKMFFAHQKVPNSCATHAILSVLLNCSQLLDIGPTLKRLKEYTKDMSPEDKGYAISNMPELARAHNSHAAALSTEREQLKQHSNAVRVSQRNSSSMEAFHFVSFVPIDGRLIELDGLKEYPIDHGPIESMVEPWTEKFRKLIRQRIETPEHGGDIRYNLMAVIPNKYYCRRRSLHHMERNRIFLLKILHFIEFYSTMQILYEHNYSRFDRIETTRRSFSTSFLPKHHLQSRIECGEDSISFMDGQQQSLQSESDDEKERPLSPSNSSSTDTASDASSIYNFTFDQQQDENDQRYNSQQQQECQKFFICKFEYGKPNSKNKFEDDEEEETSKIENSQDEDSRIRLEILKIWEQIFSEAFPNETESDRLQDEKDEDLGLIPVKILHQSSSLNDGNNCENTKIKGQDDSEDHQVQEIDARKRVKPETSKIKSFKKLKKSQESFSETLKVNQKSSEIKDDSQPKADDYDNDDKEYLKSLLYKLRSFKMNKSQHKMTQTEFNLQLKPLVLKDLCHLMATLNQRIRRCHRECEEEKSKLHRYTLDDSRRTHDYDELIITFLSMISEQGLLDVFLTQEFSNQNVNYYPLSTTPSSVATGFLPSSSCGGNNNLNNQKDSSTSTTNHNCHHITNVDGTDEASNTIGLQQMIQSEESSNTYDAVTMNHYGGSDELNSSDLEEDTHKYPNLRPNSSSSISVIQNGLDIKTRIISRTSPAPTLTASTEMTNQFIDHQDDVDDEFEDDDTDMDDVKDPIMHEFQMNGFFPSNLNLDNITSTSTTMTSTSGDIRLVPSVVAVTAASSDNDEDRDFD